MNISKTELKKIKAKLPKGAIEDVAEKTGYSCVYVGQILMGHRTINPDNSIIVTEAMNIIKTNKSGEEKLKKEIEKTLSE